MVTPFLDKLMILSPNLILVQSQMRSRTAKKARCTSLIEFVLWSLPKFEPRFGSGVTVFEPDESEGVKAVEADIDLLVRLDGFEPCA